MHEWNASRCDAMRCETRRDDGYKDQRSCARIARSFASFASFATTRTRASRGEPPTARAIPRFDSTTRDDSSAPLHRRAARRGARKNLT